MRPITDAPALLRAEADAVERGDGEGYRELFYTDSDLLDQYVIASARAVEQAARARRAIETLPDADEENAVEFFDSVTTVPAPSKYAAELRKSADEAAADPEKVPGGIRQTPNGLRYDESLPPRGQDGRGAAFQLEKAAFGTTDAYGLAAFYERVGDLIEDGRVGTLEELKRYDFEGYLRGELPRRVKRLEPLYAAVRAEARARGLSSLVARLNDAIRDARDGRL